MLSLPLILALLHGAPEDTGGHSAPRPATEQAAWLRGWLPQLDDELSTLLDGLATISVERIIDELDARVDDPRFREMLGSAMRHMAGHASELSDHWPLYQDEITRARTRLVAHFPGCSAEIIRAMAIARDCEWAMLDAEREHQTMSRGLAVFLEHGDDPLAFLDDPELPPGWRERLRSGIRGSLASACLTDIAERGSTVDTGLVRELAKVWHDAMLEYAAVLISGVGLQYPGMPARLGFESYVDVDVIEEMTAWRDAPPDSIVGAFADVEDEIDEITEAAIRARKAGGWREPLA